MAQNAKNTDLDAFREDGDGEYLTTNQGLRINDDQNSLQAGQRGPSLPEDFHLREITHSPVSTSIRWNQAVDS